MKDNSFEAAFKKVFDEASIAAPDALWNKIENALPGNGAISDISTANKIALKTKIIVGACTALMGISLILLYYKQNILSHEKSNTKAIESEFVEPKPEKPTLVTNSIVATQRQAIIRKKQPKLAPEINEVIAVPIPIQEEIVNYKNEVIANTIVPKSTQTPKIEFEMPTLELPDSQKYTPYYDPFFVPVQNKKERFWRNFKVRGGVRISN